MRRSHVVLFTCVSGRRIGHFGVRPHPARLVAPDVQSCRKAQPDEPDYSRVLVVWPLRVESRQPEPPHEVEAAAILAVGFCVASWRDEAVWPNQSLQRTAGLRLSVFHSLVSRRRRACRSAFLRRWRPCCPTMPSRAVCGGRTFRAVGLHRSALSTIATRPASSSVSCFEGASPRRRAGVSRTAGFHAHRPAGTRQSLERRFRPCCRPICARPAFADTRSPTLPSRRRRRASIGWSSRATGGSPARPSRAQGGRGLLRASLTDTAAAWCLSARSICPASAIAWRSLRDSPTEGLRR